MQVAHWKLLCAGRFDAAYEASVEAVVAAHAARGIDVSWYVGIYGFVMAEVVPMVGRAHRFSGTKVAALVGEAQKAVKFDFNMAISVHNARQIAAVGRRAAAVETAISTFEAGMKQALTELDSSAPDLKSTSQKLITTDAETADRASTVQDAATHTLGNVQSGAAAIEELSASIAEIGSQATKSLDIARRAV